MTLLRLQIQDQFAYEHFLLGIKSLNLGRLLYLLADVTAIAFIHSSEKQE
jgi:hypothetical protein